VQRLALTNLPIRSCEIFLWFGALAVAFVLGCAKPKAFAQFTFVTTNESVVQPLVLEKGVSRTWCITHTPASEIDWTLRGNRLEADQSYAITLAIDSIPGANVMTDVSVKSETKDFFFVATNCVTVTGDVGRLQ